MAFVRPGQYTRGRIDAAGDVLIQPAPLWQDDLDEALQVVNHWRSCHSFPLQVIKMTLLKRAKRVDPQALVAQRLKRLESITAKLEREDGMKLSRMHDIGGCRAVVRSVSQVADLVRVYQESHAKNPNRGHEFVKPYDYIAQPKVDGYRSIHLVYKYRSRSEEHSCYNNLRIEIQLRSRLQHAWATAVETVSTFTGQALKSNIGDQDWIRFFALMGSAMALREKRPLVPNTPNNKVELVREIKALKIALKVDEVLAGWSVAVKRVSARTTDAAAFLLVLNIEKMTLAITPFKSDEMLKASENYIKIEKDIKGNPQMQAVLVSVSSVDALQKAYPNYFLDTEAFVRAVRDAVG